MSNSTGRIFIGVGGWSFPPWRGTFYPHGLAQKRELAYAAEHLTSIEINATFYRTQKPESFAKWRDEAPDGFAFSVKAPRYATNRPALADAGASIERFFGSGVMALEDKLGPIFWQFPPSKRFDADDLGAFLALLPKSIDGRLLRHALEVRHKSFLSAEFVALAREHGAAIVVAGDAKYPQIADITAPFVYVRIMGTMPAEPLGYPVKALDLWAERAKAWAAGNVPEGLATVGQQPTEQSGSGTGLDVYLYVIRGEKALNPAAAMALIERLGRAGS
ncbi:MAG: DUF72 domain-containing protein [Rhodospirillales bacterium]